MSRKTILDTIERGIKIADTKMYRQDKIWSRYSSDKVDIGDQLGRVIRTLCKVKPLPKEMRALSIGSGNEPQFRILESMFRGGLFLFDLEKEALNVVRERLRRQSIRHVKTIHGDYNKVFMKPDTAQSFLKKKLKGKKVDLVLFHHSLYYAEEKTWKDIIETIYRNILGPEGGIHIVLMSSESKDKNTTTWLYNHFIGKYFGEANDQDLIRFKNRIRKEGFFKDVQILSRTDKVRFFADDFEEFMSVVWMILLYPNVYKYNADQKREITEYIYSQFWKKKKPLIQVQDHVVIYKGIKRRGLI